MFLPVLTTATLSQNFVIMIYKKNFKRKENLSKHKFWNLFKEFLKDFKNWLETRLFTEILKFLMFSFRRTGLQRSPTLDLPLKQLRLSKT